MVERLPRMPARVDRLPSVVKDAHPPTGNSVPTKRILPTEVITPTASSPRQSGYLNVAPSSVTSTITTGVSAKNTMKV